MFEQGLLDLGRIHVDPTGDDHVRGPVGEEDPPLVVDVAHVAEGEDPGSEIAGGRLLRRIPVGERFGLVRRVAEQSSDLARRKRCAGVVHGEDLETGHRSPDRAGMRQPVGGIDPGEHARFEVPQYSTRIGPSQSIIWRFTAGAIGAAP